MDDELIKSLSTPLFARINAERAKFGMPALVARTQAQWTWNDACPKVLYCVHIFTDLSCIRRRRPYHMVTHAIEQCKLPLAFRSQNAAAWAGKLPKDILAEVCGAKDLRYERVLSLQSQVGHKARGALSQR